MLIRKANRDDLQAIMSMIEITVKLMEKNQNDQWTGEYPAKDDFQSDLRKDNLYVAILHEKIVGCITIDQEEPEEYSLVKWRRAGEAYLFHRLAVDPDTRGEGVASKLISFAESIAIKNNVFYMKVDTYSLNQKAQMLFEKLGYEKRGEIYLYGKIEPFYCYDKILHS
ncbi:MAG TPA: GNAT family N-acetyltransferase [Bacillus sp. (in: firmicutes)]|uniref:GNAT family N-acetyltransferase n=1 Tax=Bacillus litorisediminis TaxID=2922713 RepID=UPI001FAD9244|nr:GNAT family N-acetyltransferase [Bacillus litorisediminis]HWO76265.1 GNAT family N-acetyltransferase [Bacillus sp. (in: firmicutes)]